MFVSSISLRDFRNHAASAVELVDGINVFAGPNGAGKTNLLEGAYFGLTGRSCRTTNDREVVRFGARVVRAEVATRNGAGDHVFEVGFEPGVGKRLRADGVTLARLVDHEARPPLAVFLPDRLELVKGRPGVRRAHLDALVAALWPARRDVRARYCKALGQRNALLARVRGGAAARELLDPWDTELSRVGLELMAHRAAAVEQVATSFERLAAELGLSQVAAVEYRPRSRASSPDELYEELVARRQEDLRRGHSGHGPQRDELALLHGGRSLRSYGSQGEQRTTLLALLLAEREALARVRPGGCVLLLDDVMSELDAGRRARLVEVLRQGGQSLITTTDAGLVPGADRAVAVCQGAVEP